MIYNINFSTNLLKTVPASLFSLAGLKLLDISNNKIEGCLTDAIAQAQSLVEFRASGNMITQLPDSIGDLKNLEVVDMRDNRIERLPERFGQLRKLLKLNLDHNNI